MAFDIAGRQVRTTNPLGNISTTVYDAASRFLVRIDPVLSRTSYAYDAASRQIRTTNPLGNTSTTVYDAASRTIANVDPLGNRTSLAYDAASRQVRTTNPLGNISTTVYDAANRTIANVDALGNRTSLGYDAASRNVRVQDANGKITTSVYDAAGRTTATINANGFRTTQVYDAASRRTAVLDANGHRTTFGYNKDSRKSQVIDPLGRRTTYAFDAASRQTLRIDARGNRTSYLYDNVDRVTGQRYPNGTRVTFGYDKAGQRTLLYDSTGRTTTVYDADSRVGAVISPAGLRLTYAYDPAGQRKYLIEPQGTRFTYVFDVAGRISRLTNPQSQPSSYTYDVAGRTTGIKFANSTRTSYAYDNADRLLRLANLGPTGATLSSFAYKYDGVGNKLRVVEATGDRVTWSYDNTYQLTNEKRSGTNSYNNTYTCDSVGNRLSAINGGARTTSTYDDANELKKSQTVGGVTTYIYDSNGNQIIMITPSNQRTTNAWDYENRLTTVTSPSPVETIYLYNGIGQRIYKEDSQGTTGFVWDHEAVLLETNGDTTVLAKYTATPPTAREVYGNLVSQYRNGATSYYLFDGLDSTVQLLDGLGSVTDTYLYDSWGNIIVVNGFTTNPFRYIGRLGYYFDIDTSEYYIRARHYNPLFGRFVSQDPLGFLGGDVNLYSYVFNNPINWIDPSGNRSTFATLSMWTPASLIQGLLPTLSNTSCPSPTGPLCKGDIILPLPFFKYGKYCGVSRVANCPPDPKGSGDDNIDNCCEKHDCCLEFRGARWDDPLCATLMCKCLTDRQKEGACSRAKNVDCCEAGVLLMKGAFCVLARGTTLIHLPPIRRRR